MKINDIFTDKAFFLRPTAMDSMSSPDAPIGEGVEMDNCNNPSSATRDYKDISESASRIIKNYLLERVPEFRELMELREKASQNYVLPLQNEKKENGGNLSFISTRLLAYPFAIITYWSPTNRFSH
jgi:hypothetical protein